MSPAEIMRALADKNRQLTDKNEELIRLTEEAAGKKRDYLIALTVKMTKLKLEDEKITLIPSMAKGDKSVANLGYAHDVSEGVLLACRERIKDLRESIGSARSILTWLRTELELTPNQEA